MSEDEQRRILRLLAIEKEQRRSHESLKKWATENFAILGQWQRAAEIKERAAENFSVLKSAPAKACSKKCTVGSKVSGPLCLWQCFKKVSTILDIEDSILNTVRYCQKVRDLDTRYDILKVDQNRGETSSQVKFYLCSPCDVVRVCEQRPLVVKLVIWQKNLFLLKKLVNW